MRQQRNILGKHFHYCPIEPSIEAACWQAPHRYSLDRPQTEVRSSYSHCVEACLPGKWPSQNNSCVGHEQIRRDRFSIPNQVSRACVFFHPLRGFHHVQGDFNDLSDPKSHATTTVVD